MHTRSLATVIAFALVSASLTLEALWPRETLAEVIPEYDRQGEWDEGGAKFGDIVIKGDLVADAEGWVLLRTLENKSGQPAHCQVDERVLRTETMEGARVNPPPFAVLLRSVTVSLAAHEKRSLGLRLPTSVAAQISDNQRRASSIASRRADAIEKGRYRDPVFQQTYMVFEVQYLKPLGPGDTAEKPDPATLAMRPMGYPMVMPLRARVDAGAVDFEGL